MKGDFNYSNPRVIHWGAGSVAHLESELSRLSAARVALVTTRSLLSSLDRLWVTPVGTVVISQHAPMSEIDAGVDEASRARADAIVSFGGGSAVDAAKIISLRLADGGGRALPPLAIPTTLSAAELAGGAGFTNEAGDKAGMRDVRLLLDSLSYNPDRAPAHPRPMALWLSTGIRAMDHGVEGFLAEGEHPFSDTLAQEGIRRLVASLPR